jgi:hypothetical protein
MAKLTPSTATTVSYFFTRFLTSRMGSIIGFIGLGFKGSGFKVTGFWSLAARYWSKSYCQKRVASGKRLDII